MEPIVTQSQINNFLLDYFRCKGLKKVHHAFVEEAGMPHALSEDRSYMVERAEVMEAVLAGEIRRAVSKLSDVDSTLLREIGFHLQKQALIEIIRKGNNASEALKYAQVQVAPLAKDRPEFVAELENVMSLLLYSNVAQSPDSDLLSDEQRQRTADIANAALLQYAKCSNRPKLDRIMKAILWSQDVAAKYGISTPNLLDLRTLTFEPKKEDTRRITMPLDTFLGLHLSDEDDPEDEDLDLMETEDDDEERDEGSQDDQDEPEEVFPAHAFVAFRDSRFAQFDED